MMLFLETSSVKLMLVSDFCALIKSSQALGTRKLNQGAPLLWFSDNRFSSTIDFFVGVGAFWVTDNLSFGSSSWNR
jgi:hypothetical protein